MKKSITLLICLLFITSIGWSQEFNLFNNTPGENSFIQEDDWTPIEADDVIDWRETSIGIFFMPVPLNIDSIEIERGNGTETLQGSDKLFSVGFGASFNFDFSASGDGFGNITYFAVIFGKGDYSLQAYDIFTAAKYDIKLGALSKFELSPLLGIGNLSFVDTDLSANVGNSFYFSGGARVTWLAATDFFVGADIQTTPFVFNAEKLLGAEDQVSSAKIKYKLPVQVNISLRYNIF